MLEAPEGSRGRLLMFLSLPAIVAAVLVIGAFLFRASRQTEKLRQRSVVEATLTLANEKVDRLDQLIIQQDNVLISEVDVSEPWQLESRWLPTSPRETPTVRAVLILDMSAPERQVVAFASRGSVAEAEAFRRLLVNRMLRELDLDTPPQQQLRHLHRSYNGQSYLVSYWQSPSRSHLVVAWHEVPRLVHEVFPSLFADPSGASRVTVVDEEGRRVFGFGASVRQNEFSIGLPFPTTLYGWRLQVALTTADELGVEVERRKDLELALVTVASLVVVVGLAFVLYAVEKERRLSQQKSEFVANVSHELKTPLASIRMFAELLLTGRVASEDKRKQYLEIMVNESERLTALIENVLDFARAERGKATFDFAPGDLGEVAARAAEVYRYRAEREGVELKIEVADGLPQAKLDARAMELAIINLLDNALKYAKEGKRIELHVRPHPRGLEVAVVDFGPGIAPEDHRRIFERFVRGKSAAEGQIRGTGIGLSLVKHIADAHGGKVRVDSAPGKGSTFSLQLPALASGDHAEVAS